jgi:hypothetical protein
MNNLANILEGNLIDIKSIEYYSKWAVHRQSLLPVPISKNSTKRSASKAN